MWRRGGLGSSLEGMSHCLIGAEVLLGRSLKREPHLLAGLHGTLLAPRAQTPLEESVGGARDLEPGDGASSFDSDADSCILD